MRTLFVIFCGVVLASCSHAGSSSFLSDKTAIDAPSLLVPVLKRRIRPAIAYSVLYRFAGAPDGASPYAGLTDLNGTLYGTTIRGGKDTHGTVYSITTSGAENVLYSFAGGSDGSGPTESLNYVKGAFYGVTSSGGGSGCGSFSGCGTVFKVATSGKETVLYRFKGGDDGSYPVGRLIELHGALYGVTLYGGSACFPYGCGTVFKVTLSGTETIIHHFRGGKDGSLPDSHLTNVSGTLYGTTQRGGGPGAIAGLFLKFTASGKELILHRFAGPPGDGESPTAGLTVLNGTLYGTAQGGAYSEGSVYTITTSGVEKLLYSSVVGLMARAPRPVWST